MRRALAVTLTLVMLLSPLAALPATISMDAAAQESGNVTYTGTLSLSGAPVGDGATYQYDIADLDAADNFRIDVTGATNYDRENATGTVSNGDAIPLEIAGNAQPVGPSGSAPIVELVGAETQSQVNTTYTGVSAGETNSITVEGNQQPGNVQVTFEGSETATSATTTTTGATDGSSTSYTVGGNLSPTGPSTNNEPRIRLTGRVSAIQNDQAGTVTPGSSLPITTNGNIEPSGPANNEPRVSITASSTANEYTQYGSSGGSAPVGWGGSSSANADAEIQFDNPPGTVDKISITLQGSQDVSGACPVSGTVDIYAVDEGTDSSYGEGTHVGSFSKTISEYNSSSWAQTFDIQDYETNGQSVTFEFVSSGFSNDASDGRCHTEFATDDAASSAHATSYLVTDTSGGYPDSTLVSGGPADISVSDGSGTTVNLGDFSLGQSKSQSFDMALTDSVSVSGASQNSPSLDVTIEKSDRTATEDPSVDVDGDGSADASYSGVLKSGETATIEVASLTTGSHTATTSLTAGSVDWTLDWTEITALEDPEISIDGSVAYGYTGILRSGDSATASLSGLSLGSNSIQWGATEDGGGFNATLSYDEVRVTEDPAIDTDNDGTYEITKTGSLSNGSTARYEAPGITKSIPSLSVSTTNASSVKVRAEYRERTKTDSPAVEVNGHTTDYPGIMDDGQTQTLQSDTAWLRSGTNRVNVSVGSGSLSADAPSPQVRFDYSHDAIDNQSVTYETEEWTERYSVSRSWSSDTSNAVLTIPFDGNVVSLRDAIKRTNGGSWSAIPNGQRNLSTAGGASTLDIELGTVSAGTSISVQVNGSKVDVNNGTIDVLQSTEEGRRLDSKIELTTWSADSYIMMPSSGSWNRVPYAYNESWAADDRVRINSDGEKRLRLPNAIENGVMRVSTIPVEAAPETGDVIVEVNDVNRTNPTFGVRPGQQQGDKVKFTFVEARDGKTYELWSSSEGERRDSGTASSPLTLSDDDSEETLVFRPFSGSSDDGSGPIIDSRIPMPSQQSSSTTGIVLFAGVGLVLLLGVFWYVRRRARPDKGIARTVARFIATPVVIAGLGILATVIALNYNLLGLPPTVKLIGGLAGILTATFYILRRLGMFQWRVFGVITFVVGVLGAEALRPGLLGLVLGSDAFEKLLPLLALAGVYLAYKAVQTWRRGQVTKIVVGGRSQ